MVNKKILMTIIIAFVIIGAATTVYASNYLNTHHNKIVKNAEDNALIYCENNAYCNDNNCPYLHNKTIENTNNQVRHYNYDNNPRQYDDTSNQHHYEYDNHVEYHKSNQPSQHASNSYSQHEANSYRHH